MATQAHCAFCFETLAASLEKRPGLSLPEVEALWSKYNRSLISSSPSNSSDPLPPGTSTPSTAPSSTTHSGLSTPGDSASAASSANSSTSSLNEEHPLFITYNTLTSRGDKHLRGCIGTFSPQPLPTGLSSYALTAAFDDGRFSPISASELPSLEVGVTLLTDFEPAKDAWDWEVGVHGLRISFMDKGRRLGATYLPDVAREQGWEKEEALVSLMRKAGWKGRSAEWTGVELGVTRYQGRKVALSWGEWKEWRDWVDEDGKDE
ncbi:hypothetical protein IAQ61_010523 [Plenodomus lingam]|uniref:AMMECR1 domain-containing protein n=1 Tax=Leptosphaeria maculans (strain JN3 / isolate v23.1.3 / race Av1-4-5-6-7-8) TaxID=985895 RepID=E5A488_LEPMJ|nr:hypothetical protein LEMA_P098420.1 [Plenodomus lingam JN3]KAH9862320.1 hypothetical protein IAQ61_010523 [Plenodomus lingam]CBX98433.1 hypothetical protein LEMA_P098420.1 [Plenodomus lingam JN3]